MIFKKITYSWWYLFYSAYWTAYHLGEKENPESNACYLLKILIGFNMFALFQFGLYFGYAFSTTLFFIVCILPAALIPYFSFERRSRYKLRMNEFKLLKNQSYARKRHILLIVLAIWSILFSAIGGIIRMWNIDNQFSFTGGDTPSVPRHFFLQGSWMILYETLHLVCLR